MTTRTTDHLNDRIIIVDDEQRMCDSLCALLTDDGYLVNSFQKATEAADAIRGERVDLVVTDIKMPELDGIELLKIVKEVDEEIPVILMTGYASLDTAVEAVAAGAYDYLMKPIEFTALELAVRRALDKRKAAIDRRHLLERLKIATLLQERRINELNALYEAGKSIGSASNLNDLLRQLVTLASSVTEARIGSIMLLDEKGENLTVDAASGLEQDIVDRTVLPVGESIAGYVAKTGEPLKVDDIEVDDRFSRRNRERYSHSSLLCAPLIIKNKVIGVINMANKEGDQPFTDNDLRLLVTFAAQAAVAVDDANQFEKNRRRLVEFEILHELSSETSQFQSVNQFRAILADKLARVFPVDFSLWFNHNPQAGFLELAAATGTEEIPLTETGGIDLDVVQRDSLRLNDLRLSPEEYDDVEKLTTIVRAELENIPRFPKPQTAFMAIPIIKAGQLAHVFCLGADSPRPYGTDDLSLSRLVVSQAALIFEREQSLLNATRLLTMGNMISEISHDLRKPLTSIKGSLQIINRRHPEVGGTELVQMIDSEVARMNELVRELVDFSNPNKYETQKIDLRELVERAAELVGPDLRKRHIEFTAEYESVDWELMVNKNQIIEALLNLFINAIDVMPDGGRLTVRGIVEQPEYKKDRYLALKISDTGPGIARENLPRVFDRYFTTKETGTGLGLAVVERIVSAHSGTLSVSSEENKGTTFSLYFPYLK